MTGLKKKFAFFLCISAALIISDRVLASSVDFEGDGYDEWRQPKAEDNTYVYKYDGTTGALVMCRRTNIDQARDIPLLPPAPADSSSDPADGSAETESASQLPLSCMPDFPF